MEKLTNQSLLNLNSQPTNNNINVPRDCLGG
jgi:hypothetical protein